MIRGQLCWRQYGAPTPPNDPTFFGSECQPITYQSLLGRTLEVREHVCGFLSPDEIPLGQSGRQAGRTYPLAW